MKLRRNEYCPIHRSLFCCGREQARKERRFQHGIQRVEDPHHPRGYRELRSPAEMRKLLNRKITEQDGTCAICHEWFTDYNEIVPYADIGIRYGNPIWKICTAQPFKPYRSSVRSRSKLNSRGVRSVRPPGSFEEGQ